MTGSTIGAVGASDPPDAGVTVPDAAEGAPVPATLIAATVTVYAVVFVSPVIVHGGGTGPLCAVAAQLEVDTALTGVNVGVAVTWYAVMVAPPLDAGLAKPTVIEASPADTEVTVGLPGTTGSTWKVRVTFEAAATG